jgi:hypothetical protein
MPIALVSPSALDAPAVGAGVSSCVTRRWSTSVRERGTGDEAGR